MNSDLDYAIGTLIHELAHIIACYNPKKLKRIEQEIKRRFPKENAKITTHI